MAKKKNAIAPDKESFLKEKIGKSEDTMSDFMSALTTAQSDRGQWGLKRDTYYRMRMRMRKEKNFPFPNCSNLRLPTAEKFIRKSKSALVNFFWGNRPRAMITPTPTGNPDAAMKLEYYVDCLIEDTIKPLRKLCVLDDKKEEQGFAFIEVIWKMEDERRRFELDVEDIPKDMVQQLFSADIPSEELIPVIAKLLDIDMSETVREQNIEAINKIVEGIRKGDKKVTVDLFDETYNNVDWIVHDPMSVFVPAESKLNPQEARWIAVETFEPWDVVKRKAKDGIYDQSEIEDIDIYKDLGSESVAKATYLFNTVEDSKNLREGIERLTNSSKMVRIHRVYAWYDLDGDGVEERNVFIIAPDFKKTLSKFPFPYEHRKWPIVRFDYEVIDDRWYSTRGQVELLEDYIKETDTQHNQKIDNQTIRNAPMFAFRSGVVNPRLVKFIPGQGIPIPGTLPLTDSLAPLNFTNTNAEFSYRDEEMLLKSEMQELIGQIDFSLQSQINKRQPRTAYETGLQQQSASTTFGLDVLLFSDSMAEVLDQTVKLLQQYLPEEVYFTVMGEGAQIRLSREEIQGGYTVKIRASEFSMTPTQRLQNTMQKIGFLTNPQSPFMPTGVVTPANLFYMAKRMLQDQSEFSWNQWITMPQQVPPGPPPAITTVKPNFDSLTDAEQAQVLASGGIQPDAEGRMHRKQQEMVEAMDGKETAQ